MRTLESEMPLPRYNHGTNTQTDISQSRTRRRIQLEGIGAFLLALGCARAWLTLLFVTPEPSISVDIDIHRIFDYFYFAAALCIALCARRISSLKETKWAAPALAILMLSASFFCGIPTLLENAGGQAPLPSSLSSLDRTTLPSLPLTLCGFLLIPSEGFLGTVVSSYMISAGYSFMALLIALMLYDISKRFGIMVLLLFCLKNAMQIFVVWGRDFASMIERSGLTPGTQEAVLIIIVVALISSMAFILYSEKGLTSTWGVKFIETDLLDEQGREEKACTTLCEHLSSKHKLSPREDEILRLYAQGLNGPQIERELFIAEGTLKTQRATSTKNSASQIAKSSVRFLA